MGMEVWPRALVEGPGESPGPRPARSLLILAFRDYVLDFRNPSAAVLSDHSFADIEVILNDIDYVLGRHPWARDERGEMYLAPSPVRQVAGFPEYDSAGNGSIVLTRTTQPPWVPVSQERVIGSEIRDANADLAAAEQR